MNINVKGLEFFEGDQGDRPFTLLAHGTVVIGQMTFQGVALTWSPEEGATALAPAARCQTGAHAVRWSSREPFFKEIASQMMALYHAMGGKLPVTKRQYVPYCELDLSDDPSREEVVAALDKLSDERGVICYTGRFEVPPVVPIERRHPSRQTDTSVDDDDDMTGLHRTLGVTAEAEACDRAGL